VHTITEHGDSKTTIALSLNLSCIWESLVSFMHRKHYTRRKGREYGYLKGCGGPKVSLNVFGKEKKI